MGKWWKLELMIAKPLSIEDVEVAPPKADEVRIKVL
jgi:Zn-dependent alcohol dehydrogenase